MRTNSFARRGKGNKKSWEMQEDTGVKYYTDTMVFHFRKNKPCKFILVRLR